MKKKMFMNFTLSIISTVADTTKAELQILSYLGNMKTIHNIIFLREWNGLNDPLLRMRLSIRVAQKLCKSISTQKVNTEKWSPIMNYELPCDGAV